MYSGRQQTTKTKLSGGDNTGIIIINNDNRPGTCIIIVIEVLRCTAAVPRAPLPRGLRTAEEKKGGGGA